MKTEYKVLSPRKPFDTGDVLIHGMFNNIECIVGHISDSKDTERL